MIALLWACSGQPEALDETTTAPPPEATVVEEQGPLPEQIAASHILVKYAGAANSAGVTRTRDRAHQRIVEGRERILGGEDFRLVAFDLSEDASASRGGWIGVGDQQTWVPAFTAAAFSLEVGELSEPVETEFGWHLIRREAHEPVFLKHIVVRHRDSPGGKQGAVKERSPEEAVAIAEAALARIEAGEDFSAVARELSDGAYGPRGGDLGEFLRGQLGAEFDAAVAELDPGEVSPVFETQYGAHLLLRYE